MFTCFSAIFWLTCSESLGPTFVKFYVVVVSPTCLFKIFFALYGDSHNISIIQSFSYPFIYVITMFQAAALLSRVLWQFVNWWK